MQNCYLALRYSPEVESRVVRTELLTLFQDFDARITGMDRNLRRTWRRHRRTTSTPTYHDTDEDVDMVAITTAPVAGTHASTSPE